MASFPGDLESSYSDVFSNLIKSLNQQYFKELKIVLQELELEEAKVRADITTNAGEYQKVLKRLRELRGKIFNKKLFKDTLTSMNNVMDRLAGRVERNIRSQLKNKKQPIPSLPLKADSEALDVAIRDNVDLITDITGSQALELENAVLKAVTGGKGPFEIIREVESISDNGKAYAEFVARDQIGKAHADINQDMQTRAGFPGYDWETAGDGPVSQGGRVRDDHWALRGTFHLWSEPPLITPQGNKHPGEDFQCRCIAVPSFGPG